MITEITKSKIRLKLTDAIEKIFENEDLIEELQPFYFSDNYSEKMAAAAIAVLDAQKDLYEYLIEQGLLKE